MEWIEKIIKNRIPVFLSLERIWKAQPIQQKVKKKRKVRRCGTTYINGNSREKFCIEAINKYLCLKKRRKLHINWQLH